ncbi:MAG TPA: hypothetical protein VFM75_03870 [Modicisalibacter sp.]|nr:hypothetical protein [Modicisalibacter sp.]
MHKTLIAASAMSIAGMHLPAHGDTTLHYRVSKGENAAAMVLKARANEIRMEGAALGAGFNWMVYHGADDTLYAIDPQRKVYYGVDAAAIDQLSIRLAALRDDLRERLKTLPEEQQAIVRSQMGAFLDESAIEPLVMAIDMGAADTIEVNGIACDRGRITAEGQPIGEICVASPQALGLTGAEFDAFQNLYDLTASLQAAFSQQAASIPDVSTLNGVPVSMHIEFNDFRQTLERVTHDPLPDYLFEVPENYRREGPQSPAN